MPLSISLISAGGSSGGSINPVIITTSILPDGQVGVPYSATLSVLGGFPPYIWSISSGALPAGLTMDSNGNIIGTPTTPGLATFTVLVIDGPGFSDSLNVSMSL